MMMASPTMMIQQPLEQEPPKTESAPPAGVSASRGTNELRRRRPVVPNDDENDETSSRSIHRPTSNRSHSSSSPSWSWSWSWSLVNQDLPPQYAAGLRIPNLLQSSPQHHGPVYKLTIPWIFVYCVPQFLQLWFLHNIVIVQRKEQREGDDEENKTENEFSWWQRWLYSLLQSWFLPHWKARFLIVVGKYMYKFPVVEEEEDDDGRKLIMELEPRSSNDSHDPLSSSSSPSSRQAVASSSSLAKIPPKGRPVALKHTSVHLLHPWKTTTLSSSDEDDDEDNLVGNRHRAQLPPRLNNHSQDWIAAHMPPPFRRDRSSNINNNNGNDGNNSNATSTKQNKKNDDDDNVDFSILVVTFGTDDWNYHVTTQYYATTEGRTWQQVLQQAQAEVTKREMGHVPSDSYPPAWMYCDRLGDALVQTHARIQQRLSHSNNNTEWSSSVGVGVGVEPPLVMSQSASQMYNYHNNDDTTGTGGYWG